MSVHPYVVISPCRNEAEHMRITLDTVVAGQWLHVANVRSPRPR